MTIDTELCGVKDNGVLTHVLLDGDVPVCDVTVEAGGRPRQCGHAGAFA